MKSRINEVRNLQKIAGLLKEDEDFDLSYNPFKPKSDDEEVIKKWYMNSNPYVRDLSPEEVEAGIEAHFGEWTSAKNHYASIQDYLDDIDSNTDWY